MEGPKRAFFCGQLYSVQLFRLTNMLELKPLIILELITFEQLVNILSLVTVHIYQPHLR